MRAILALLLLMLGARESYAQSDMDDFKRVLTRFLDEQRIFLNCSALDPDLHNIVVGNFDDMVKTTLDLLHTYGKPPDISDFEEKTKLDAIYMHERKFGEVIKLCAEDKDWQDRLTQWKFMILQNEASEIFYFRHHPGERSK
jgi:hypothetical protein